MEYDQTLGEQRDWFYLPVLRSCVIRPTQTCMSPIINQKCDPSAPDPVKKLGVGVGNGGTLGTLNIRTVPLQALRASMINPGDLHLPGALEEVALTASREGIMGRIPELLGGRSEEEPGPVKFKGRCRKSSPPTWGEGKWRGQALSAGGAP